MPDLTDHLRILVDAESPSADPDAVDRAQDALDHLATGLVGERPHRHRDSSGPTTLEWRLGDPEDPRRVLLLGHIDTVWPLGTLDRRPFTLDNGRATGPGVFDMKAGLVVALHAVAELGRDLPVTVLVTGDEEIGSAASRATIERVARECQACLVLEGAGPDGAVKSARKGWSFYTLVMRGIAAHAGLEPENGLNVLPVLARAIGRMTSLNTELDGASVHPTTARAGTTANTIPDHAELTVDVRCTTTAVQERVHEAIRSVATEIADGTRVELRGGANRPPLEPSTTRPVLDRLNAVQDRRGLDTPADVAVGGISDANLVAALGVPTLDGLGAVGGGPHAEHEWIDVAETSARVPMLTELVRDLVTTPLPEAATPHDRRTR